MQTQYLKREMFRRDLRDDHIKQFYKSKRKNIVVPDETINQMLQADNLEFIDQLTKFSYDYVDQLVIYGGIDYFYKAFLINQHQENAIFALANLSQNDDGKFQIFNLKIHYQIIQDLEVELKDLESLSKQNFKKIYYRLWFLNSQCEILEDYQLIKKYEDLFLKFVYCTNRKVKYECLYGFLKLPYLVDYDYILQACLKQKQNILHKINIRIIKVLSKILDDKFETLELVMNLGILQLIELQITQKECKSHIYIILSRLCSNYCEQIFQNDIICQEIISDSYHPKFKGKLIEIFKIIISICPITIFHLMLERLDFISIIHGFLDDEHFVFDNYDTLTYVLFRLIKMKKRFYYKEFEEQILYYVISKNDEVSEQFEQLLL